ncbi:phosphoribosylanthranilate isomerase [candidate division NPL-UPA2 bacterium]|nr:phosphoribosylanthranilate isomerase [candidate division NPL-UPA2 bacterium]
MTRIKICGITNLEDALRAVELRADAIGFVFAESPRRIDSQEAARIIRSLPPFVTVVGLFVDEGAEKVREIMEYCRLDALQFHGNESPEYCKQFSRPVRGKSLSGFIRTIKAFRIKDEETLKSIPAYQVDAYLLDAYVEGAAGGTGKSFNWDLAVEAKKIGRPIILAGGLGPDNVAEAIRKVRPYGVDVSSQIERTPGKKDHEKMRAFMKAVRRTSQLNPSHRGKRAG